MDDGTEIPLTFAQEHFFGFSSDAYAGLCTTSALLIEGEIDSDAFTKSYIGVTKRNEALRASIDHGGRTVQRVLPEDWEPFFCVQAAPAMQDETVADLADSIASSIDASSDSLPRSVLCRRSSNEHLWIRQVHHIHQDAWMNHLFLEEFWATYRHLTNGGSQPDLAPPVSFIDYARRQHQSVPSTQPPGLDHWATVLGSTSGLRSSGDGPEQGGIVPATLDFGFVDGETVGRLADLARQTRSTVASCVVAAFSLLVGLSGEALPGHVRLGNSFLLRNSDEERRLMALVAQQVPMAVPLDLTMSIGDMVHGAFISSMTSMQIASKPGYSYFRVVTSLAQEGHDGAVAIKQAMNGSLPDDIDIVLVINTGESTGELSDPSDLVMTPLPMLHLAKFNVSDLVFMISPGSDRLDMVAYYNSMRLPQPFVQTLLRHLEMLLGVIGSSAPGTGAVMLAEKVMG